MRWNLSLKILKKEKITNEIEINEEKSKFLKLEMIKMFSGLKRQYSEQFEKIKEEINKIEINKFKEIINLMYESFIIIIPSYFSSIILSYVMHPHSNISRYPEGDSSPEEIYTLKLPLVELLPKLMEIQEKTIKGIKEFCKYMENIKERELK